MTTIKPGRWAKILLRLFILLVMLASVVASVYLLAQGFAYGWPDWTGVGPYTPPQPAIEGYQREKTLWDWLQLLLAPVFLPLILAFFANRFQLRNAAIDRELAEKRAQDSVLETYLDRMAELLVDKNLVKSQPDDEVRDIARIRTLTALRRLDGEHNIILIQFLRDAKLLGGQSNSDAAIIDLSRANLEGADLRGAYLPWADLRRTDLTGANLGGADLQSANLRAAILHKANLEGAGLRSVDLQGTDLAEANLHRANLHRANLGKANLRGADLRSADLRGAALQDADLRGAKLQGAFLQGADLQQAVLQGPELKEARLQGATMPDGSKHE